MALAARVVPSCGLRLPSSASSEHASLTHVSHSRLHRPFPQFIEQTLARFPDAGVCDVEEARVLEEEGGYQFLDVRSATEYEYKITPSIHVPLIKAVFRFDSVLKRKVPQQTPNVDFVAEVERKVPDKATKLIVMCSDGRTRTLSALQALDEAGYTHIVGMRGGYNGFSRVFDGKFWRRVAPDAMREVDARDFQDQTTGSACPPALSLSIVRG